jgi:hypothetical protein
MTTTVIFDASQNDEISGYGPGILVGQTATLPFDLSVGSLVDFQATIYQGGGSFAEQASVYTYNSSTNALGSLLGTSAQVTSSGLADFDVVFSQGASGQIAIVISSNAISGEQMNVGRNYSADYTGGTMIQSNDGGSSYLVLAAYDFGKLSVTPAVSAVPEPSAVVLMGAVLVAGAAFAAIRSKFVPRSRAPMLAA